MKTIKAKDWSDVPSDYTGIVEYENGDKEWYKNGIYHREDGPAWIYKNDHKRWYLEGKIIWNSFNKLDFTNQIIFSKLQHPEYPLVQAWKILDLDRLYEQTIIPGMEEFIIE